MNEKNEKKDGEDKRGTGVKMEVRMVGEGRMGKVELRVELERAASDSPSLGSLMEAEQHEYVRGVVGV